MATIPDPVHERSTAHSIIKWYARTQNEDPRPHLGCSEIGKECNRALWFSFRWATRKKFEGRILRLFKRGHREEPLFIEELKAIGAEVYDRDPDTQQQHRFYGYRGHFGGSCDAIGRKFPEGPKSWAIVEFKTHGEKSFTELVKNGVQNAKFEHFVQMQMYMGFSDLDRALYLAVNKNTDELHSEWIHFDQEIFDRMNERAQMIIEAEEPPSGISNDPAFYKCKFCDHQKVCHDDIAPAKSCRTCVHVTLADEGQWKCEHYDRFVTTEEQIDGCRDHLYLPPLIKYAEPLDAGKDWIKYRHKETGLVFANITHGADRSEDNMTNDIVACFDSDELAVAHSKIVGDNKVAEMLSQLEGARIVASEVTDDDPDSDIPF